MVRLNIHSEYLDNSSSHARNLDSVYNSSSMDTYNLGIPLQQTVESIKTSRLHIAVYYTTAVPHSSVPS